MNILQGFVNDVLDKNDIQDDDYIRNYITGRGMSLRRNFSIEYTDFRLLIDNIYKSDLSDGNKELLLKYIYYFILNPIFKENDDNFTLGIGDGDLVPDIKDRKNIKIYITDDEGDVIPASIIDEININIHIISIFTKISFINLYNNESNNYIYDSSIINYWDMINKDGYIYNILKNVPSMKIDFYKKILYGYIENKISNNK